MALQRIITMPLQVDIHLTDLNIGAPYYSMGAANNNNNLTAEDVFQVLKNSSEACPKYYSYTENMGYAVYYGLSN